MKKELGTGSLGSMFEAIADAGVYVQQQMKDEFCKHFQLLVTDPSSNVNKDNYPCYDEWKEVKDYVIIAPKKYIFEPTARIHDEEKYCNDTKEVITSILPHLRKQDWVKQSSKQHFREIQNRNLKPDIKFRITLHLESAKLKESTLWAGRIAR